MTVAAILVAAGSGVRLGRPTPKAFCSVGGRTLLEHAAVPFLAHPAVRDVIVVAPRTALIEAIRLVPDARVVPGGATRQASVACGLAELASDIDTVLVHDVARPFVPAAVIDRVLEALADGAGAVVPARPVTDTVKRVDPTMSVVATVERTTLWAVQTPQGFRRDVLVAAHEAAPDDAHTDDAGLVEAVRGRVLVVQGADEAFKITTPWDLGLAEALALWRDAAATPS